MSLMSYVLAATNIVERLFSTTRESCGPKTAKRWHRQYLRWWCISRSIGNYGTRVWCSKSDVIHALDLDSLLHNLRLRQQLEKPTRLSLRRMWRSLYNSLMTRKWVSIRTHSWMPRKTATSGTMTILLLSWVSLTNNFLTLFWLSAYMNVSSLR